MAIGKNEAEARERIKTPAFPARSHSLQSGERPLQHLNLVLKETELS